MDQTFLVTSVVAAVEFLRRIKIADYWDAATILVAAVIGALAGAFNAPGVPNIWTGIVLGLGAAGIVTVATAVNGKASISTGDK